MTTCSSLGLGLGQLVFLWTHPYWHTTSGPHLPHQLTSGKLTEFTYGHLTAQCSRRQATLRNTSSLETTCSATAPTPILCMCGGPIQFQTMPLGVIASYHARSTHLNLSSANQDFSRGTAKTVTLVRFIFICTLLFEYPLSDLFHIFGTK